MSMIPKAFLPTLVELSGFNRSKVKVNTQGPVTFNPFDMMVMELPEGLLDMSTFAISAQVKVTATAGGAAPPPVEQLIDTIYVEVGGESIIPGFTFYNYVWNIHSDIQGTWNKQATRAALQLQPTGSVVPATATSTVYPFQMNQFLGFLNDVKVLHTNRLPPVRLYIRWASAAVLNCSATASGVSYQIQNVYAYVDQIKMPATYKAMLDDKLSRSPIEIAYTNYSCVPCGQATLSQNSRWSTSADCVEAVHCTFLQTTYNNALQQVDATTFLSLAFTRGTTNTNTSLTSQLSINGEPTPAFPQSAPLGEVMLQTLQTFGEDHDLTTSPHPEMNGLANFNEHFFVHSFSFTWNDVDSPSRKCGLSGRGNQLLGVWNTYSTASDAVFPLIIIQHKSVLEMGAGRSFRYIH